MAHQRPDSPKSKPDAKQAAQGGVPFEEEADPHASEADKARQRDEAHGFSQDSGYPGSGGTEAEPQPTTSPKQRKQAEASERR